MNLYSLLFLLYCNVITPSWTLIIDGEFTTSDFFKFVRKFGFDKIQSEKHKSSYGYVFGNITSKQPFPKNVSVTMAMLDFHHFLEFYSNR